MVDERKYGDSVADEAARVLRQNDQGGEPAPEPPSPASNLPNWSQFPLDDIIVFITGELIALPWCFYAQEAWVRGEYLSSFGAYIFGLPVAIAGASFHWWKRVFGENTRNWIMNDARRWWPLALVLAFVYVIGPDIYRRSTGSLAPVAAPAVVHDAPTADEIAKATEPIRAERDAEKQRADNAIKELDAARRAALPPSPPPAAASSFAQTYQLSDAQIKELRDEIFAVKNSLPPSIRIQLVNEPSARALANELEKSFTLAGAHPDGLSIGYPDSPQDVGIMIRVGDLQSIPDGAKKIAAAIKKVTGVDPRFVFLKDLKPDEFNILVGPNPNG